MAQIGLSMIGSSVGTALGGPIGGFIGNVVGGYIGGLVDNMLFGGATVEGPRLEDLRITSSTYGKAIPKVWGPENRLAGNLIWTTGLIETRKEQSAGKGGPSVSNVSYSYRASLAIALAGREIHQIRKIWANGKLIFDAGSSTALVFTKADGTHDVFETLRIYQGDFTQTPDPTIESYLGAGEVPAYRGTAYVVIADLQLADFGNRLPSLEFLVEADEAISTGTVISEICEAAGIDPANVSTSQFPDNLRGFIVANENTCHQALQPLGLAYNFDLAEVWGSLRFQKRGTSPSGTIILDDFAGHEMPNERPEPLRWTRAQETQLPLEAVLTYHDPERDFQPNSQSARRAGGSAQSKLSTQVALTLDDDHAREIADRMLWEAWVGRTTATGNLTDRWLGCEPGRSYIIPTPAGPERLRLAQRVRGANGVIEATFRRDRRDLYNSTSPGATATVPDNGLVLAGDTTLILLDTPIFRDSDDDSGFYWLAAGENQNWRGAEVYRSTDSGSTYQSIGAQGSPAVMGDVVGTLGDGATTVFDRVNTITVELDVADDELTSATTLEVLNGANACWIGPADGQGGELLQFEEATAVSGGVYELSGLLRGRLGTEIQAASHGAGERFVLLDVADIARDDFGASEWNKSRLYKPVSFLQVVTEAASQTFTNTGEGKKPLSPVHVDGVLDGSDNLTISWIRRSRYRQPGLGNGLLPVGEQSLEFEVDIYDGATVVRTITVTGAQTVEYTAAEQTADGLTPGDPVTLTVYQMSDARGRGTGRQATV